MRPAHLIAICGGLVMAGGCQTNTHESLPQVAMATAAEPSDPSAMLAGGDFDAFAAQVMDGRLESRPDRDQLLTAARTYGLGVEIDLEMAGNASEQALQVDFRDVLDWQLKRAKAGDVTAMWNAACIYDQGLGIEIDSRNALYWFDAAATARHARAAALLANYFMGNAESGVAANPFISTYYRKIAAEEGDADACYLLSLAYLNAYGVIYDRTEWFRWLTKAAQLGQQDAQMELARRYEEGDGVRKNNSRAFGLYKKLYEAGNQEAIPHFAKFLFYNAGTEADPEQALTMLEEAAANGSSDAMETLCGIYTLGPKGVGINLDRAILLGEAALPKASERMHVHLAHAYEKRNASEEDRNRSFELYEIAAREGDSQGQRGISEKLLQGDTRFGRDLEESLMWIRMAAEEDPENSLSQMQKGIMEAFGLGCEPSEEAFSRFLEIAVLKPAKDTFPWLRDVRVGKLTAEQKCDELKTLWRMEMLDPEPPEVPELDLEKWQSLVDLLSRSGEDLPPAPFRSISPTPPLVRQFIWFSERVEVIILVDTEGRVADFEFVGTPLPPMRAAIERALPHWHFLPAIQDGKPVALRIRQSFVF